MSTKSRSRALRRHPELANPEASQAIGHSILSLVTLGMFEKDTHVAAPNVEAEGPTAMTTSASTAE